MNEKQKIINLIVEKFFYEGIAGKLTMDELASELKISKKTIYKHFPSKEALISDMVKNFTEKIKDRIETMLKTNDNAVVKIKNLIAILGAVASKVSDQWLFALRNYYPDIWKYIDNFRQQMVIKNITKIIEQGKKESLIIDAPPQIMINTFIGAVRNVVTPDFILNNNFSIQQAMGYTLQIFFNGILTEKGRKLYKKSMVKDEYENNFITL